MKTILNKEENEIIINNSKFICYLIPLENNNVKSIINEISNIHPKATHICYGYIYDNEKYSTDDNEPSNTAGLPILNVLEKEELNRIISIVVRYFGGIKLGAGGLVRAYTKATTECLKKTIKTDLEEGYKVKIIIPYEEDKNIKYILQKENIIEESYQEKITIIAEIRKEILDKLNKYNIEVLENTYIKKNIN